MKKCRKKNNKDVDIIGNKRRKMINRGQKLILENMTKCPESCHKNYNLSQKMSQKDNKDVDITGNK